VELKSIHPKDHNLTQRINDIFGEDEDSMFERIKGESIYGSLESYTLIHLIVKTADNLKQEQFALQLIYQFDYIFKLENLPLILTPYEVLSMGPDCGIIEMVKDSVTFDKLKKVLKTDFSRPYALKEFFEMYFIENLPAAKEKFLKSLAAYSLVMYFLQAKDRHNGNILLHKSGKIFHIDFGFFLSNMPGKGM
jgi:phosphatidylinositol kinase/protein kinase (PI-3  family)